METYAPIASPCAPPAGPWNSPCHDPHAGLCDAALWEGDLCVVATCWVLSCWLWVEREWVDFLDFCEVFWEERRRLLDSETWLPRLVGWRSRLSFCNEVDAAGKHPAIRLDAKRPSIPTPMEVKERVTSAKRIEATIERRAIALMSSGRDWLERGMTFVQFPFRHKTAGSTVHTFSSCSCPFEFGGFISCKCKQAELLLPIKKDFTLSA